MRTHGGRSGRGPLGGLLRVPWKGPALLCVDLTAMPTEQVVFFSTPPMKSCDLGPSLNLSLLWFPRLYLPHQIVIRIG